MAETKKQMSPDVEEELNDLKKDAADKIQELLVTLEKDTREEDPDYAPLDRSEINMRNTIADNISTFVVFSPNIDRYYALTAMAQVINLQIARYQFRDGKVIRKMSGDEAETIAAASRVADSTPTQAK